MKYHYNCAVITVVKAVLGKKLMKDNFARVEKHRPQHKNFIVISNHTDVMDPVYVTVALDKYIRFVAGDHTLRNKKGWMYKYLAGVIVKHKEKPSSVLTDEIKHDVSMGVPVGLFAEGAVTVNGQTCFVSENTGKLIRESGAALITYRFVGAYLKRPRWGNHKRKGPVKGYFVHEYAPEELKNLSDREITDIIERDIYVNVYDEQRKNPEEYKGEALAEAVERILYICPSCKNTCTIESHGDFAECKKCGYKLQMKADGFFHDTGKGVIFDNILDWDLWQREELQKKLKELPEGSLVFSDDSQSISIIRNTTEREMLSYDAEIKLFKDKFLIDLKDGGKPHEIPVNDIKQVTFSGKDAILIIAGDNVYDIRCKTPRSSIKYVAAWRYLTGREYR